MLHRRAGSPLEGAAESRRRKKGGPMHRRAASPLLEGARGRRWELLLLPIRLHQDPLTSPQVLLPLALPFDPSLRPRPLPCPQVPRPRPC